MTIKAFHSRQHRLHDPQQDFDGGMPVPYLEVPQRIDACIEALSAVGGVSLVPAGPAGDEELRTVHSHQLVEGIKRIAEGLQPGQVHRPGPFGDGIFSDPSAPVVAGTFEAVRHAAGCALEAARTIGAGEGLAIALCRPPGHHAGKGFCGGYCYCNNAAMAAQLLSAAGRVAVLDLDYHHGHGTQDIFYERADVIYTSLHADPQVEYPYRWGFERERGLGAGVGYNSNYPLPRECDEMMYLDALGAALKYIASRKAQSLVVSLGFDTHYLDPYGGLGLSESSYRKIGAMIAGLKLPIVAVFEGGYNLEVLGGCWREFINGVYQPQRHNDRKSTEKPNS